MYLLFFELMHLKFAKLLTWPNFFPSKLVWHVPIPNSLKRAQKNFKKCRKTKKLKHKKQSEMSFLGFCIYNVFSEQYFTTISKYLESA